MKRILGALLQFLVYLAFRGVETTIRILPLALDARIGAGLGEAAYWLAVPYRKLARRNLDIAFSGEKTAAELDRINRLHFRALGRNFFSSLKLARMTAEQVESLVSWEGREHIEAGAAMKRGLVAALAHLGPWEMFSQIPSLGSGIAPATMYRGLPNRFINRFIVRQRGKHGIALFDRFTGVNGPLRHIRDGGGVGILIDQHAGDHGVWCPFFGRLASTTTLPALLSSRTACPIVTMSILPDGHGRWKILYYPPILPPEDPAGKKDVLSRITRRLNEELEASIRRAPQEWFWVHDRWKSPNPSFLLSGCKRGIHLPGNAAALKPFRVLLRSPNPLGDACMAIPAVRAIKSGRPDLHLTILCRENLKPLWTSLPEADEVIAAPKSLSPRTVGRLLKQLAPFDAAILFPNSLSSALEAWHAGIPLIAGHRGHRRAWLMQSLVRRKKAGPPDHHVFTYLRIAEHVGASVDNLDALFQTPPPPAPPVPTPAHKQVGICPGAEYGPAKCWPADRFAEAVSSLHRKTGCRIAIFGSAGERSIAEQIANAVSPEIPIRNRAGETAMEDLIEELRHCHVLLTNDTGPMHLAAALGVPTVSLFGSTEPRLTRPIGPHHRVIRHQVECSPCFLRDCPRDFRCMERIAVEEAVDAVAAML